jgi:hypothetical protein
MTVTLQTFRPLRPIPIDTDAGEGIASELPGLYLPGGSNGARPDSH